MVEYTVVSVFGILVLTTGPGGDVIIELTNAIRDNYKGYSYAVSLSDYPDKEDPTELIALYNAQGMPAEQRDYLVDYPKDMINDIMDYSMSGFPSISDGLALFDEIGLGIEDFCGEGCPLSLF